MDAAYDLQKAGKIHISRLLNFDRPLSHFIADQLEVVALERLNSPHSGVQISHIVSVTALYEVIQTENVWRLVHRATEAETPNEELVASFQGIICKKDLPPFTERLGYVRSLIVKVVAGTDLQQVQYQACQILATKRFDNRFAVIDLQQYHLYCC